MHLTRRAAVSAHSLNSTARRLSTSVPRMAAAQIKTTTPSWHDWRLNPATATPVDSVTFRNQADLPRLPVPPLDVTLAKVVESCRPLAKDASEFEALQKKVEEFGEQGGMGQTLQKRLEDKREQQGTRNWIAEDWDTDAYMAYRDSVVVNVSYYYGFKRLPQAPQSAPSSTKSDPAYVAASIVETAMEFRDLLVKGELIPEPAGKEGGELCMESFKWAYNACRVPAQPADYAVKVAEDAPEAQHMVVIRKNHFYTLPLADSKGRRFTVEEFRRSLQQILDGDDQPAPGVGILTGINRDRWHDAHVHLLGSAKNAETISAIHASAFVLAFDDATPEPAMHPIEGNSTSLTSQGICEFSERLWKAGGKGFGEGEAANRWWDKPLQWVVFANGEAGFIGEHSCMDGTPTARMNDFLSKRLLTQKPSPIGANDPAPSAFPEIKSLEWDLDAKSLEAIEKGTKEFAEHVGQYTVNYLKYGRYGKDGIKAQKTSPDGWTQMIFQLAYYMTHGHPCGTYEAAQVRRFQLGRTETVRICTDATVEFTKAMVDPSKSAAERKALFQKAIAGHGKDMKNASAGMGIDRHLFGLRHLVKKGEEAPLLSDPLLARSSTWNMSTSQIFIQNSPAYGWGPVAAPPESYGIPYMIHNDHLQFTITAHERTPGKEFIANLGKAADMIMDMAEGKESKL